MRGSKVNMKASKQTIIRVVSWKELLRESKNSKNKIIIFDEASNSKLERKKTYKKLKPYIKALGNLNIII